MIDALNKQGMMRQTFGPRMAKPKKCDECIYKYDSNAQACKGCPHGKANAK